MLCDVWCVLCVVGCVSHVVLRVLYNAWGVCVGGWCLLCVSCVCVCACVRLHCVYLLHGVWCVWYAAMYRLDGLRLLLCDV